MPNILFENILGSFVFDEKGNLVEHLHKGSHKHKDLSEPSPAQLRLILAYFKQNKFYKDFYERNAEITRKDMRSSKPDEILIIQAVKSITELEKVKNILLNRIRDWYGYYNPEFTKLLANQEKFIELIIKKDKSSLMKELHLNESESMGIHYLQHDVDEIRQMAKSYQDIDALKKKQESYLDKLMQKALPSTSEIATPFISAQLVEAAGSLKKLSELPSSSIQLMGAEKSLFRHMKNKANRSPKYGFLFNHPIIQKAPVDKRGKIARLLASKIDICIKVDYFKGDYIAAKMQKQIDKKISVILKEKRRIKPRKEHSVESPKPPVNNHKPVNDKPKSFEEYERQRKMRKRR